MTFQKPFPTSSTTDPLVIRIIRQFKTDLMRQEAAQMAEMTQRWFQIEQRLQAEFLALALEIEQMQQQGTAVGRWKLAQMARYQTLLDQVARELEQYADYAAGLTGRTQAEWGGLALEQALEAISAAGTDAGLILTGFDRLPVSAIQNMVGLAGDGSPLRALFVASWPEATDAMLQALIDSIALGRGPIATARDMANRFGVGLDRAMRITRTEQLRVYREATRMQYQASQVVEGYYRVSARDSRVCPACLIADDGTIYPLDVPFAEHVQGRCGMAPALIGAPRLKYQTGEQWFVKQDAARQQLILGKGAYAAWKSGKFVLLQIVKRTEDPVWGAAFVPRPLKELVN